MDDNGSGMTALLQALELYTSSGVILAMYENVYGLQGAESAIRPFKS